MKNKKLTYILLPAAAIIWGLVFWQIYAGLNPEEELYVEPGYTGGAHTIAAVADTFQLSGGYSDPFLDRSLLKNSATGYDFQADEPNKTAQRNPKQAKPVVPKVVKWPNIAYKGFIINNVSGDAQAVLTVNDREQTMRKGEVFMQVELLTISQDSIEVAFAGETKRVGL